MIILNIIGILAKYTFTQDHYAVFGKISAAILNDSPVTIAYVQEVR